MKPSDIYRLNPIKINEDLLDILECFEYLEIKNNNVYPYFENLISNLLPDAGVNITKDRVFKSHIYMDEGGKHYGSTLSAIYFKNKPLMLVKKTGIYLGSTTCYLTDIDLLEDIKNYLKKYRKDKGEILSHFDVNDDITELEKISKYNFKDYYKEDIIFNYKKDDIVWGFISVRFKDVPKDSYILTRLKITGLNAYNPRRMYDVDAIDIGFNNKKGIITVKLDEISIVNEPLVIYKEWISDNLIIGLFDNIPYLEDAIEHKVNNKILTGKDLPVIKEKDIEKLCLKLKLDEKLKKSEQSISSKVKI